MTDIQIKVEDYSRCSLQTPRWWGGEVPLEGNRLLVGGGNIPSATDPKHETGTTEVELLDLMRCRSERLGRMLQSDHRGSQPQILRNGQAVFFGGMDTTIVEIMSGKVVRSGGQMLIQRSAAASVELSDGRVLITGGYSNAGGKAIPQSSVEIYDPKTQTSTAITSMQFPRASHSITPIGSGKYLVIGGVGSGANTSEIFDETAQSFTPADALHSGRKDHRAVMDNAGRIWIIGGTDARGQSQDVLEYYDLTSGKFVATQLELAEAREDMAALFIPQLDVILMVGGQKKGTYNGHKDPPVNLIEVLDLRQNRIQVATLLSPRDEPTLQVLSVNPKARMAEILVLQGVAEGPDGQKRVPLPEKVSIKIN